MNRFMIVPGYNLDDQKVRQSSAFSHSLNPKPTIRCAYKAASDSVYFFWATTFTVAFFYQDLQVALSNT